MTPFFVSGLPRSRTAWAAVWLTTDDSLCYHDRMFDTKLITGMYREIGFSGPELVFEYKTLMEKYPNSPWLVLERRPDDCYNSFKRVAGPHLPADGPELKAVWKQRLSAYGFLLNRPNVLAIQMNELDTLSTAALAWNHLLGSIPFDRDRWEVLCEMNIQQNFEPALKKRQESWQSYQPSAQSLQ